MSDWEDSPGQTPDMHISRLASEHLDVSPEKLEEVWGPLLRLLPLDKWKKMYVWKDGCYVLQVYY